MVTYNIPPAGLMFLLIHGFGTRPFLLSSCRDSHTYADIGQWWDSSGTTQEALQHPIFHFISLDISFWR
uniref:Uncharacterized protein n=1 Tax=Romanomermis culicivorax TaxID=13658 RepID=A0A915HHI7_ROMCU